MQYVLLAAKEANQPKDEPEIVTGVDENRKVIAAKALKEAWWSEKVHRSQQKRPYEHYL